MINIITIAYRDLKLAGIFVAVRNECMLVVPTDLAFSMSSICILTLTSKDKE